MFHVLLHLILHYWGVSHVGLGVYEVKGALGLKFRFGCRCLTCLGFTLCTFHVGAVP